MRAPQRPVPIALALVSLAGCAPAAPAANVAGVSGSRAVVVDVSQWPGASHIAPGQLVAYNGGALEILDGCVLRGGQTSHPLPALGGEPRVIRTQNELDAVLPLHDPALAIGGGLPIATVSLAVEERRLAVLEDNAPPSAGPCARATHVVTAVRYGASAWRRHELPYGIVHIGPFVTPPVDERDRLSDAQLAEQTVSRCAGDQRDECHRPLSLTLVPIGADKAVDNASLVHFRDPEGAAWSAYVGGRALCRFPCALWVLPGAEVELRRADGKRLFFPASGNSGADRDLTISRGEDEPDLWVGIGGGIAGLVFVGASVAIGFSGSASPSTTNSSVGDSIGGAAEDAVAPALLGALGAFIAVGSAGYLLRGPKPVFSYRLTPHKAPVHKPHASRPALSFSASGVGLRF